MNYRLLLILLAFGLVEIAANEDQQGQFFVIDNIVYEVLMRGRIEAQEVLLPQVISETEEVQESEEATHATILDLASRIARKSKSRFLKKVFKIDCSKLDMKDCLRYYAEAVEMVKGPLCLDPVNPKYYYPAINNFRLLEKRGENPTAEEHAFKNMHYRIKMREKRHRSLIRK